MRLRQWRVALVVGLLMLPAVARGQVSDGCQPTEPRQNFRLEGAIEREVTEPCATSDLEKHLWIQIVGVSPAGRGTYPYEVGVVTPAEMRRREGSTAEGDPAFGLGVVVVQLGAQKWESESGSFTVTDSGGTIDVRLTAAGTENRGGKALRLTGHYVHADLPASDANSASWALKQTGLVDPKTEAEYATINVNLEFSVLVGGDRVEPTTTTESPKEQLCPAEVTRGAFAPTQGVWQDDPYFKDRAFASIARHGTTGPYMAELPMVADRPTLLFGVERAPGHRGDRKIISLFGRTAGTTSVPVRLHFRGRGTALLDNITRAIEPAQLPLAAPCESDNSKWRPFRIDLAVDKGFPPQTTFTFDGEGQYGIDALLETADGRATGVKLAVTGISRRIDPVHAWFLPVIASPKSSAAIKTLGLRAVDAATASRQRIPDLFPLPPGGLHTSVGPFVDLNRAMREWHNPLTGFFSGKNYAVKLVDQALAHYLTVGAVLGGQDWAVAVVEAADLANVFDRSEAGAFASTSKVVVVGATTTPQFMSSSTAHEMAHTVPRLLWSSQEMTNQCFVDFHNDAITTKVANGFQLTQAGAPVRRDRDNSWSILQGRSDGWIDQCTYVNLVTQLDRRPDPRVLLVTGLLGREMTTGSATGTFLPSYEIDGVADEPQPGGDHAVVLRDAAGGELSRFAFGPDWIDAETGEPRDVTSFAFQLPVVPGTRTAELVGPGGTVLATKSFGTAPTLDILEPKPGSDLPVDDGQVKVRWDGAASDDRPLSATVLYSTDGGRRWVPQVIESPSEHAAVRITPGEAGKVKVIVTDGSRSAERIVNLPAHKPAANRTGLVVGAAIGALVLAMGLVRLRGRRRLA